MRNITKTIFGLGALLAAGQAAAQQSVIVGGLIDQYLGTVHLSGEPGRRTVIQNGGMSTSWFGFRGSEQLTGGLKAEFALSGFFLGDSGASGRFGDSFQFSPLILHTDAPTGAFGARHPLCHWRATPLLKQDYL